MFVWWTDQSVNSVAEIAFEPMWTVCSAYDYVTDSIRMKRMTSTCLVVKAVGLVSASPRIRKRRCDQPDAVPRDVVGRLNEFVGG